MDKLVIRIYFRVLKFIESIIFQKQNAPTDSSRFHSLR